MDRLLHRNSILLKLLPWIFLITGVAVTLLLWNAENKNLRNLARQNFSNLTYQIHDNVFRHFDDYQSLLEAAQTTIGPTGEVSPADWRNIYNKFTTSQSITKIDTVSFIRYLKRDQIAGMTANMQNDHPDFEVFPKSKSETVYVTTFSQSFGKNGTDIGFDIGSSPERRQAAEAARDKAQPQLSKSINPLTRNRDKKTALYFQPVYRQTDKPDNIETRRATLTGWIALSIDIPALFKNALIVSGNTIHIDVFDVTDKRKTTLIYNTSDYSQTIQRSRTPFFIDQSTLSVGGRLWRINYATTQSFDQYFSANRSYMGLVAGIAMSLAIWLMAQLLITSRQRAIGMVKETTTALRNSEQRFRDLTTISADWFWETDQQGVFTIMSPQVKDIIGLEPDYCVGKTRQELVDLHTTQACQENFEQWKKVHECIQNRRPFTDIIQEWIRPDTNEVKICVNNGHPFFDNKGTWLGYRGTCRDITVRVRAEEALRTSEEKYRNIINSTSQGYWLIGPDRRTIEVNQALCDMLDYDKCDILNKTILDFIAPGQQKDFRRRTKRNRHKMHAQYEVDLVTRMGDIITTRVDSTVLRDHGGHLTSAFAFISNITAMKAAEKRIQHMATHDVVTNLSSRNLFTDRLEQAMARSRRDNVLQAVMFLDLDGFKLVNDQMGHQTGDDVLRMVAGRLLNSVRETDTVARHGGDEFTILLTSVGDREQLARIAEKIIAAISEPYPVGGEYANLSVSIGIATCLGNDGQDSDSLMHHADEAMYKAKREGGQRYKFAANLPQKNCRAYDI